jgi:hypothetical protein
MFEISRTGGKSMNKRIKELMKQSETPCGFNPDKFAELIVRECAQFADNSPQYVDGREILEHFGVEE